MGSLYGQSKKRFSVPHTIFKKTAEKETEEGIDEEICKLDRERFHRTKRTMKELQILIGKNREQFKGERCGRQVELHGEVNNNR